ncbi:MAG TPA: hypothetical protein VNA25_13740 [Phycisphaerae bacterium]|nr:hypothetical protein [Phycisphaerae bacterium]
MEHSQLPLSLGAEGPSQGRGTPTVEAKPSVLGRTVNWVLAGLGVLVVLLLALLVHRFFAWRTTYRLVCNSPDGMYRCTIQEKARNGQVRAYVALHRRSSLYSDPNWRVVKEQHLSSGSACRSNYSIDWHYDANHRTTGLTVFGDFGSPPFEGEVIFEWVWPGYRGLRRPTARQVWRRTAERMRDTILSGRPLRNGGYTISAETAWIEPDGTLVLGSNKSARGVAMTGLVPDLPAPNVVVRWVDGNTIVWQCEPPGQATQPTRVREVTLRAREMRMEPARDGIDVGMLNVEGRNESSIFRTEECWMRVPWHLPPSEHELDP